jgi:hypothetical protein
MNNHLKLNWCRLFRQPVYRQLLQRRHRQPLRNMNNQLRRFQKMLLNHQRRRHQIQN